VIGQNTFRVGPTLKLAKITRKTFNSVDRSCETWLRLVTNGRLWTFASPRLVFQVLIVSLPDYIVSSQDNFPELFLLSFSSFSGHFSSAQDNPSPRTFVVGFSFLPGHSSSAFSSQQLRPQPFLACQDISPQLSLLARTFLLGFFLAILPQHFSSEQLDQSQP
jgi:hypothetical protein